MLSDYIMPTSTGITHSIDPPPMDATFSINPSLLTLVHNTLQFTRLPHEDTNQHLARFLTIYNTFKVHGVSDNAITLRVFPFSIKDRAWSWLESLTEKSIKTWDQLVEKFIGKYFPPSKTGRMRNEITNFSQHDGESL